MIDSLPSSLKRGLAPSSQASDLQKYQESVRKNMAKTCLWTSLDGIMSGMYTTNPMKSLTYLGEKFQKGRMK